LREEFLLDETPRVKPIPTGSMLRILGVTFGIAVSLGSSIGSGIMGKPSKIAAEMPSEWLIMSAWLLGALYSLLGAWSLAEVGAMMPSAGGYYTIARRAYGDYIGYAVGWNDWISNCSAVAAAALLIGDYARDLQPRFQHPVVTGALVVAFIALLQWRGIRWGSQVQNFTSAATAVVFVVLIAGAFLVRHGAPAELSAATLTFGKPLLFAYVPVLQAVIFTYDGWYSSIYFGDEIVNPGREIPRSMVTTVFLLSGIFLLINIALFHGLGLAGVAKTDLPVAALGAVIFGPAGETFVKVLMITALFSLINAVVLASTRNIFAMSRDGWGLRVFARVNRGGTPSLALLVSILVSFAFLLTGSFDQVIAITTFFFVAKYGLSYLAVYMMRRREPDAPRPYRTWGYPWTTALAVAGSAAFLVGAFFGDKRNSLWGIALLLASYPVYLLTKRFGNPQ
jgi:basic amino acid/polyamine antiporter, APA family